MSSNNTIYQLQTLIESLGSGTQFIPKDTIKTDFKIDLDLNDLNHANKWGANFGRLNVNYQRVWTKEELDHLSKVNKERNINFVSNGATEAARIKNTGKKQSKEHITKRIRTKQIEIDGILYNSGKEAARALGYKPATISSWAIKNGSRYGIKIPTGSNQYTNGNNNRQKNKSRNS